MLSTMVLTTRKGASPESGNAPLCCDIACVASAPAIPGWVLVARPRPAPRCPLVVFGRKVLVLHRALAASTLGFLVGEDEGLLGFVAVDGRIVIVALYQVVIIGVRVVFFHIFTVVWVRCGRRMRQIVPQRTGPRRRMQTGALPRTPGFSRHGRMLTTMSFYDAEGRIPGVRECAPVCCATSPASHPLRLSVGGFWSLARAQLLRTELMSYGFTTLRSGDYG